MSDGGRKGVTRDLLLMVWMSVQSCTCGRKDKRINTEVKPGEGFKKMVGYEEGSNDGDTGGRVCIALA